MRMDRYSDAAAPSKRKNPEKQREEEEAWAIQTGRYVTLDEYLTREAVTYPTVPGNRDDVNQALFPGAVAQRHLRHARPQHELLSSA
jgi:hypothetical protein